MATQPRKLDVTLIAFMAALGIAAGVLAIVQSNPTWMIGGLVFLMGAMLFAFTRSRGGAHPI